MEERKLGNIYGFSGGNYAGNVYDKEKISPTITTFQGGNQQPMIVAMRGRNSENPSDRTAGSPTEQRLEPNSQGICNTLTSVQKDNMVLENVYDFYNSKIKEDGMCGTITTGCSHNGSGTFGVIEKNNLVMGKGAFCIGGLQEHQTARTDGISPSLTAAMGMGGGQTPLIPERNYRIRKLTPLECWRLMGFSDKDFLSAKLGSRTLGVKTLVKFPDLGIEAFADIEEKSTLSNSQAYKQAGNSIVKPVLMAILGQLIPGKEDVYKEYYKC